MAAVRNILFIMCDQLRWDYLSCQGAAHLQTPQIDRLAAEGVRFPHTYVQGPICGPSRMSFYTGRYMRSHRATWNNVPLPIDEIGLGEYLQPLGLRTALAGKTHMQADAAGIARLGLAADSPAAVRLAECGFEPYERDDGLYPAGLPVPDTAYHRFLRQQGYDSANPWHDFANSAQGQEGQLLSGWQLRHAGQPIRLPEELSETAYMTTRAQEFIRAAGENPWCLHLSYIKPHWPYMAAAPYHALFGAEDIPAPVRGADERERAHPLVREYMALGFSQSFQRDAVRQTVIPTYMGLVRQIDDHIGRLLAFLQAQGRMEDTLIVFTSDHGDFLGDHWLGEKELFYEASVRIPLIIRDPSPAADATRGQACPALVEAIDLVPTFVELLGGTPAWERLEGRSLLPLLHSPPAAQAALPWREAVFSEADFSFRLPRQRLNLPAYGAWGQMVFDGRWKLCTYRGLPAQLFDLQEDPHELEDRAAESATAPIREELQARLREWQGARRWRATISDAQVIERPQRGKAIGMRLGEW